MSEHVWVFTHVMMSLLNMRVCIFFFKWVVVMRWFHLLMCGCNVLFLSVDWVQIIVILIMYNFVIYIIYDVTILGFICFVLRNSMWHVLE